MPRFEDTKIIHVVQEKSHTNLGVKSATHTPLCGDSRLPYGLVVLSPEPPPRDGLASLLSKNTVRNTYDGLGQNHGNGPSHSSRTSGPCLPYAKTLDLLVRFRAQWILDHTESHTHEPLIVWITHSESPTKINPGHFFSRGFSPSHTLFLETLWAARALPPLLPEERKVHAIVLDGFAHSRVVTQMARRWLRPSAQAAGTVMPADQLDALQGRGGFRTNPGAPPEPSSPTLCFQNHYRLFILSGRPSFLGDRR